MRARVVVALAGAAGLLAAGCSGGGSSAAKELPTVAASPMDTPTPPVTAPPSSSAPATSAAASSSAPASTPATAASSAGKPTGKATSLAPTRKATASAGPSTVPVTTGSPGGTCMLRLSLSTPQASYPAGQTVSFIAQLSDVGTGVCTFTTGAQRGFTVSKDGTAVWQSGCSSDPGGHEGPMPCPQYQAVQHLGPGQSMTRNQDWSQQSDASGSAPVGQVAPGSYTGSESWAGQSASAIFTIS